MTPNAFLYNTLREVCEGTYLAYQRGKAPVLPWFVYQHQYGEEVFADNANYARLPKYRVQLLFKENDPKLVDEFETALSKIGTWRLYDADYLDSEDCIIHDYRVSLNLSSYRESENQYYG